MNVKILKIIYEGENKCNYFIFIIYKFFSWFFYGSLMFQEIDIVVFEIQLFFYIEYLVVFNYIILFFLLFCERVQILVKQSIVLGRILVVMRKQCDSKEIEVGQYFGLGSRYDVEEICEGVQSFVQIKWILQKQEFIFGVGQLSLFICFVYGLVVG